MLIYLINDALHGKLRHICYLFLLRGSREFQAIPSRDIWKLVCPTIRDPNIQGRPHSQTLLKYSRLLVISYSYIAGFFCNHCQYITIRWSYPISYSHCIPSVVHYSHCVLKNPDSFPWRIYSNNYTYSYASFSQIKYP